MWVLYSILSAFGIATADAFTKKISPDADDYILNLSRFLYATPFVLLLLFFIHMPKLDSGFWIMLSLTLPIEVLAQILYVKAIRISPLSIVAPFLSLTSVFLVFTSYFMLGELPTFMGFSGILFVVIGAYILNLNDIKNGLMGPFKSIFREKGCVYMMIVAFLFSITSNLGKILVQKSSPLFFSSIYVPLLAVSFGVIALFTSRVGIIQLNFNFKGFFFIGLFYGLSVVFHTLAILLTIVPYMISVKRTSSVFSVFYGYFLFKEKNIMERVIGAIIMLIGTALIIFS